MAWLFSKALIDSMNSPCSQARAAESSADVSLAGELYAPSSATSMPPAYSWRDKTTDALSRFRSGMTFVRSMGDRGEVVLTSYLAAFPVRTFPPQEKEQESTASAADSGPKWRESLAKYDPDSRSWKTQRSCRNVACGASLETLPRWGMTQGGELYPLPIPSGVQAIRAYITSVKDFGLSLRCPTPSAAASVQGRNEPDGRRGQTLIGFARRQAWHYVAATPTARDWKSGKASQATMERNSRPLSEQVGGTLNPTWVEWLMGWPIGWTDLEPLETDKFQAWLDSHGNCLPEDTASE